MPLTYTQIAATTLTTSSTTVTFNNIPQTYTDLVLRMSARATGATTSRILWIRCNNNTSGIYSSIWVNGSGSATESSISDNATTIDGRQIPAETITSNTFGNSELYFADYRNTSHNKQIGISSAVENNAATGWVSAIASSFRPTESAAISRIDLLLSGSASFVADSSFYLYGIKRD